MICARASLVFKYYELCNNPSIINPQFNSNVVCLHIVVGVAFIIATNGYSPPSILCNFSQTQTR